MTSDDDAEDLIVAAATIAAAAVANIGAWYHEPVPLEESCDVPSFKVSDFENEILDVHDAQFYEDLRMDKRVFKKLCRMLATKGLLRNTRSIPIKEQVSMFLYIIGHNERNRVLQKRFNRSGETISRYFHMVLDAVVALAPLSFQLPGSGIPPETLTDPRFYPYFKDCVGVIDGIHIPAAVGVDERDPFRNKSGFISQNVMAACSFDLCFQYVLAGWEGSVSDSHVLHSALTRSDKLIIPKGKYYLVDGEYPNMQGLLAPYDGVRNCLSEFADDCPPENAKELFNYRHSLLRSTIDRAFGVLKARFPILKTEPLYHIKTQVKVVIAACVIHNHIRREKKDDWIFMKEEKEAHVGEILLMPENQEPKDTSQGIEEEVASQLRDSIANAMWNDYLGD
ncbi:unnamed protein product [Victoria cruziana]